MRWAIFGIGGMGREAADIVRRRFPDAAIVFVTDTGGASVQGIEHVMPDALRDDDLVILAIGDPQLRFELRERLGERRYGTIVASSAIVAPSAVIGEGSIICEGSIVNNDVRVGQHVIVNVLSHLSHDCIMGDFVTVSPRVSCNGWVKIDDKVFVGAGAVIRNGAPDRRLRVGVGATIGAGAVVVGDVVSHTTVLGVPARSAHDPHRQP